MNKEQLKMLVTGWVHSHPKYPDVFLSAENLVELVTLIMDNYESEPVKRCVKAYIVNQD